MNIDRSQIGDYLSASPLHPTLAEAHGILCGLLCCGASDPVTRWLDQIMPLTGADDDASQRTERAVLRDYALSIETAISGPDLAINIPTPDESAPLIERAAATYDWVRGFLYAMGVLGISEQTLSEDAREVYRDFLTMTRMDFDDLDETEDNEQALTEVTEFIRVAAMLIHDERIDPRAHTEQT